MSRVRSPQTVPDLDRRVWFPRVGRERVATTSETGRTSSGSRARIPRISRLLALAIRYEQLLRAGHVRDFSEMSQVAQVSSARLTQIMNLLLLAPEIQEAVLLLPETSAAVEPVSERALRPIVSEPLWAQQRQMWARLVAARCDAPLPGTADR